jgi:hypothetical protein
MQELHSKVYGPYGILAVCYRNLWTAVRTKLGQEEWLRSPRKPRAKRTYCSRRSGNHVGVTTVARQRKQLIPVPWGVNRCPVWREANSKSPGPVRHGECVINAELHIAIICIITTLVSRFTVEIGRIMTVYRSAGFELCILWCTY